MRQQKSERILREPETLRITGLDQRTLDREEAAGRFPRRVQLTPRTVGWRESEVTEWVQTRPRVTRRIRQEFSGEFAEN
jgi:prophage regulatory protein